MIELNRFCLACRRILPEETSNPILIIGYGTNKWHKKKHKHIVKPDAEEFYCFCEKCAEKMQGLIEAQIEKGLKVL